MSAAPAAGVGARAGGVCGSEERGSDVLHERSAAAALPLYRGQRGGARRRRRQHHRGQVLPPTCLLPRLHVGSMCWTSRLHTARSSSRRMPFDFHALLDFGLILLHVPCTSKASAPSRRVSRIYSTATWLSFSSRGPLLVCRSLNHQTLTLTLNLTLSL